MAQRGQRQTDRRAPSSISVYTTVSNALGFSSTNSSNTLEVSVTPTTTFSKHFTRLLWHPPVAQLPISPHFLLVGVFAFAAFGPGLQPISLSTWCFFPTIILYSRCTSLPHLPLLLTAILLGTWLSYFGILNDPYPTLSTSLKSLSLSLIPTFLFVLPILLDRITAYMYHPTSWFASLTFGASFSGLWTLYPRLSPLGSLFTPGSLSSLASPGELTQLVSLIGSEGLIALFAFSGPIIAFWLEQYSFDLTGTYPPLLVTQDPYSSIDAWDDNAIHNDVATGYDDELYNDAPREASEPLLFQDRNDIIGHLPPATRPGLNNRLWTPTKAFFAFLAVSLFYGGARTTLMSGNFFQRSVNAKEGVNVGCVSGGVGMALDKVLNATSSLAIHGADLVVWSEAIVIVDDGDVVGRVDSVFDGATWEIGNLTAKLNITVGVSLLRIRRGGGRENTFVLFSNEGERVMTQRLGFSFPFRGDTPGGAGAATLQSTPIPTSQHLRVAAIIGTDVLHPRFTNALTTQDVDIVVMPAADWGAYGRYGWRNAVVKGLESGVSVVRCASRGISGAVTAYGEVVGYREVGGDLETGIVRVPMRRRVKTWYAGFGWVMGWGCMGFSWWVSVMILTHRRITGFARRIVGLGYW